MRVWGGGGRGALTIAKRDVLLLCDESRGEV